MTDKCPSIEILTEVAGLPPGDPRRAHLDDCPRCQARAADYLDFMAGGTAVPPDRLDAAMGSLKAALDAEIHPNVTALPPRRPFLARPVVRGVLALAALLLIVIALSDLWERPRRDEIRLRAPEDEHAAAGLTLNPAEFLATGGVRLSWTAHPAADDYELLLLAPDLTLLETLTTAGETEMLVEAQVLERLLDSGRLFVWRVRALAGGDPLTESQPESCLLDGGDRSQR